MPRTLKFRCHSVLPSVGLISKAWLFTFATVSTFYGRTGQDAAQRSGSARPTIPFSHLHLVILVKSIRLAIELTVLSAIWFSMIWETVHTESAATAGLQLLDLVLAENH